jgi:4-hydroxythreonine-4-phosphate dehydrogenase
MSKPVVAITMGDPAGVGPEVVLKALASSVVRQACQPLVVGDLKVLNKSLPGRRHPLELIPWKPGKLLPKSATAVPVLGISSLRMDQCRPGKPTRACGEAVFQYIKAATNLVTSRFAQGMATAPISKRVLQLAGHRYPGHTELLAELTRTKNFRMMLLGKRLKVVLVTVHLPLVQAAKELTRNRIRITLELADQWLRQYFKIPRPRLAVAALNPHAGEEGMFGREEKKTIVPALQDARALGIEATGPLPADTLFYQAVTGKFDAAICMYHDQGLIPLKLLYFYGGVGLTLGIPLIRTSVDHGTAYDIAGQNRADASSMKEAILLAAKLARHTAMRR